ncbi:MAG: putative peptidoglycan glycosyltransferase FtsW [Peptoniphilus sp.]|nr:putative peptidoglycan glycosyltransferase FtsW [Peptoniphilus sp.]MDD7363134.1 putative peptidoglycan glycosyltransferase FtsW [Bacillota bacterium]MDY6044344.1 putative peptidoglycan glycosyltransferase FtsW [Peptoniphilus sp.]
MARIRRYVDPVLFVTILLLLTVGVFMVASSSWTSGLADHGDGSFYLKRHILFLAFGFAAMAAGYLVPLDALRKAAFPLWLLSMGLCLLLYTRFGVTVKGATRWLAIPGTSFQFMPSDLLKYTSIFYVAHLCAVHRNGRRRRGFLPIVAVIGLSVVVVMKEDFSTASVITISLMGMFFISGMTLAEFLSIVGLGVATMYGFVLRVPYRLKRLTSFVDPFDDIANTDWQLANSLYSIGIGSVTGVGYFNFHQSFNRLPEAYNDFIFAVIGQELGLIGTTFVIVLFAIFIFRGFQTAIMQEKLYEKLVATGIFLSIGFQAFFNMGVATGLLPVTGITLPFISYGGTALVLAMGMSGILLRLSGKGVSR